MHHRAARTLTTAYASATTSAHAPIMPRVAVVATMSTPISLIPTAFHRHAAAANPAGKGLESTSVDLSLL